jgi:hypothetical protein
MKNKIFYFNEFPFLVPLFCNFLIINSIFYFIEYFSILYNIYKKTNDNDPTRTSVHDSRSVAALQERAPSLLETKKTNPYFLTYLSTLRLKQRARSSIHPLPPSHARRAIAPCPCPHYRARRVHSLPVSLTCAPVTYAARSLTFCPSPITQGHHRRARH